MTPTAGRARIAILLCLACSWVVGCGAGLAPAFDSRFNGLDADATRALAALGEAVEPAQASVLLATTRATEPELVAFDLAGMRLLWRTPLAASARPEVHGELALVATGPRLFAFDLRSGRPRWSAPLDAGAKTVPSFLGAACERQRCFFSARHDAGPGQRPTSVLTAVDAATGRVRWQHRVEGEVGTPVARGGVVVTPWEHQRLSLLDAEDGHELARFRSQDDVIEWVAAEDDGVYFGHRGIYRLGRDGYAGTRDAAPRFELPDAALPGNPPPRPSAFAHWPGTATAMGRVALHVALAQTDGAPGLAGERYYFMFHRHVFGLDPSGQLQWAYMLPTDAITARAVKAGLLVIGDDGEVRLLAASDGHTRYRASVGERLASASVALGELPAQTALDDAGTDLRTRLTELILDQDNRLVPARAWAIARLSELPEDAVTEDLLDIYAQSTTPPELEAAVATALRTRTRGTAHLVDALLSRYDFLDQTRPAPLSVIVPALVERGETRAVPGLLERMWDHETPLAVLPAVVDAVVTLGDASVTEPLLELLRMYRADSSFRDAPEALLAAARGVLRHGDEVAHDALAAIMERPGTSPELARGVAELLRPAPAVPTATAPEAVASAPRALPPTLDQSAINGVFSDHVDALRSCIIAELGRTPRLSQVRIAFIAEHDGSAHAFRFVPNSQAFVDCLYPHVAGLRFPRFAAGRQVASYVIAVRTEPLRPQPEAAQGRALAWWSPTRAAAADAPPVDAPPWWKVQSPIVRILGETPAAAKAQPPAGPPAPQIPAPTTPPPASAPPPTPPVEATEADASTATTGKAAPPPPPATTEAAPAEAAPTPASEPATDAWWLPEQ